MASNTFYDFFTFYMKLYSKRKMQETGIKIFVPIKDEQIKKHKWYDTLRRSYDAQSYKEDFDSKLFIEAQFERKDLVYPNELFSKKAYENFIDYKKSLNKERTSIDIAKEVAYSLRYIKNSGGIKKILEGNFDRIESEFIPIYPFVFSKSFLSNTNLSEERILAKRTLCLKERKIVEAIKSVLGDDYE